jgi:mRNA-degrading endonuclease toxin of MazEF toxin-antitoxin module
MRQFEIWKAQPAGFESPHYFVIISGDERCQAARQVFVNGLACFTLRGQPSPLEVRLNGADGFDHATVCQCDFLYSLQKSQLKEKLGTVGYERQQQIKERIRNIFRLH